MTDFQRIVTESENSGTEIHTLQANMHRSSDNLMRQMMVPIAWKYVFPSRRHVATLVINKCKSDLEASPAFGPPSMLDTAGKLLEKLFRPKLTGAMRAAEEYSPKQYGFRGARSTIYAIEVVVQAVRLAEAYCYHCLQVVLLIT